MYFSKDTKVFFVQTTRIFVRYIQSVAKFATISIALVGVIINRPRALNERPYIHRI